MLAAAGQLHLLSGRNFKESHTNQADGVVTRNSVPGSEDFASEQKKIGTWILKTEQNP